MKKIKIFLYLFDVALNGDLTVKISNSLQNTIASCFDTILGTFQSDLKFTKCWMKYSILNSLSKERRLITCHRNFYSIQLLPNKLMKVVWLLVDALELDF